MGGYCRRPRQLHYFLSGDMIAQALKRLDGTLPPPFLLCGLQVRVPLLVIPGPLRQQMIHHHPELVRDGHGRLLPSKRAARRRNVRPRNVGVLRAAQAHWTNTRRKERLPGRMRPGRHLPALSLFPGDTLAHDAKRVAEPKRLLSVPVSARISRAAVMSAPGMLSSGAIWDWSGATSTPIC